MEPHKEIEWVVCLTQKAPISGSVLLYEDDGLSLVHTKVPSEQEPNRSHVVLSFASTGQPRSDFATFRAISFRLLNTIPQYSVSYNNGTQIPWSRVGGKGTWSFDAKDVAVVIELPFSPIVMGRTTHIVIETQTRGRVAKVLDGLAFQIRRARTAKDEARITPGSETGQADSAGALLRASSTGSSLEYLAGTSLQVFDAAVLGYDALFAAALQEVKKGCQTLCKPQISKLQANDLANNLQMTNGQTCLQLQR